MMLVTKDSEDDVDLDQEVAYHVCVAARARRDDVRRAYTICEIFNTEISVGFTLSKHKLYEWFHAGCHARASKREAPRADEVGETAVFKALRKGTTWAFNDLRFLRDIASESFVKTNDLQAAPRRDAQRSAKGLILHGGSASPANARSASQGMLHSDGNAASNATTSSYRRAQSRGPNRGGLQWTEAARNHGRARPVHRGSE